MYKLEQIDGSKFLVNIGPIHPSTHGVLRLLVEIEGERVRNVVPIIGQLHRGFEKICENRSYVQVVPLTDRLDYLSSMGNNMAYVKAVEDLLEVEVPERAEYIRVIVLELQRIASHLASIGFFSNDLGMAFTLFMYTMRDREKVLNLFEMLCGARLTYNFIRIGGVAKDLPKGFVKNAKEVLDYLESKIGEYRAMCDESEVFRMRTEGVGILTPEDAINLGATGPVLRGSGLKIDTRAQDPYTIYDQFDWKIVTGKRGDCYSRYTVWVGEIEQSINIVRQALDNLPEGEVMAKVPKVIKPPAGEAYARTENPRGELAVHVVSDGGVNPYRVKIRSPAFCNLSILPHLSKDVLIPDLIAICGSLDPVFGEVDR
ncbi:MAG: NADH-quinone oxidoreductase subunit D [Thermoplasmata archaeon]|nr:MAG: NADH-quinone oxidoreductase subunit D [Thermoplasmata archaeon]